MGLDLPPEIKPDGTMRDIDLFLAGGTKVGLEDTASTAGLSEPSPVDGGLCELLIREGTSAYVRKDGVTVELQAPEIFDDIRSYEIPGTDGLEIRSFGPEGILAAHILEPKIIRFGHLKIDRQLAQWFEDNDVQLPRELRDSIDEFHRLYKETYPMGTTYRQLASIYTTFMPESIRKRFRKQTHRFMRDHAGRVTPYAD